MVRYTLIDLREKIGDEEFYVSQCLEYDMRGIGTSSTEAREDFLTKFNAKIDADKAAGIPLLRDIPPAPKSMWDKYNEAVKLGIKIDRLE